MNLQVATSYNEFPVRLNLVGNVIFCSVGIGEYSPDRINQICRFTSIIYGYLNPISDPTRLARSDRRVIATWAPWRTSRRFSRCAEPSGYPESSGYAESAGYPESSEYPESSRCAEQSLRDGETGTCSHSRAPLNTAPCIAAGLPAFPRAFAPGDFLSITRPTPAGRCGCPCTTVCRLQRRPSCGCRRFLKATAQRAFPRSRD